MLPLVASQALALSRTKQDAGKRRERKRAAHGTRKRLLSTVLDALVESRKRRAEIEIAYYRRMREESSK
jgi:hypothetical protein